MKVYSKASRLTSLIAALLAAMATAQAAADKEPPSRTTFRTQKGDTYKTVAAATTGNPRDEDVIREMNYPLDDRQGLPEAVIYIPDQGAANPSASERKGNPGTIKIEKLRPVRSGQVSIPDRGKFYVVPVSSLTPDDPQRSLGNITLE